MILQVNIACEISNSFPCFIFKITSQNARIWMNFGCRVRSSILCGTNVSFRFVCENNNSGGIPFKSFRPETIHPLRWWPSYNFEQKWDPLLQVPREVDSQTNCRLVHCWPAANCSVQLASNLEGVRSSRFCDGFPSGENFLSPTLVLHLADRSRWTYPWAREERFNFLSRTNRPFNGHPRFLNDSRK